MASMSLGGAMQAPAPPERAFPSREALLAFVHDFSVTHGYAVVTQKSNVPRGQLWLRCDLGGDSRSRSRNCSRHRSSSASADADTDTNASANASATRKRRRVSASRQRNCPFRLYARRLPSAQWALQVQHATHNHAVATDARQLVSHPIARRLSLEQKRLVRELTEAGARPARILARLQERFPDKPFKVQDIYNTRNFIRRERLAGRVAFADTSSVQRATDPHAATETTSATTTASGPAPVSQRGSDVGLPLPRPAEATETGNGSARDTLEPPGAETRLQEAWQSVQHEFPTWRRTVQLRFAQQLQTLVQTCSRRNVETQDKPGACHSDGDGDGDGDSFMETMAPASMSPIDAPQDLALLTPTRSQEQTTAEPSLDIVSSLSDDERSDELLASAMDAQVG